MTSKGGKMRKLIICIFLLSFITVNAHAAEITITIPDQYVNDVLDAFDSVHSRVMPSDVNLTKAQWAKRCVREYIKNVVVQYKNEQSAIAATQANTDEVEAMEIN
jgi:hypothetical protein